MNRVESPSQEPVSTMTRDWVESDAASIARVESKSQPCSLFAGVEVAMTAKDAGRRTSSARPICQPVSPLRQSGGHPLRSPSLLICVICGGFNAVA